MSLTASIKELASVDMFSSVKKIEAFVGRPFYVDYERAFILVADAWKMRVGGIPQGTFLLAFYENEPGVSEALLLRALKPARLPTDNDVISSMVEYYKDDLKTAGKGTHLDDFTRYEFSFSGLECRVLGTFYKGVKGETKFGADVENFYSSHNYNVYKPTGKVLERIANFRDNAEVPGSPTDVRIGRIRYSSSLRFQDGLEEVPVYVSAHDFLGKRTALFGMTRTGKSNTVKKVIQATVDISGKAKKTVAEAPSKSTEDFYLAFADDGTPKYKAGQIIFDINGEYANANMQDEGTAIFELYKDQVVRYSVLPKAGFKVLKVNFYNDISAGFELAVTHLAEEKGDYVSSFRAANLDDVPDATDHSATTRFDRVRAAYLCCLFRAGFTPPSKFKVTFQGCKEINDKVRSGGIDPSKGITLEDATSWFLWVWDNYDGEPYFTGYRAKKGREWADEDLKAILAFLSRKRAPGGTVNVSGYTKLRGIIDLHTDTVDKPFAQEIIELLRNGKIVIVDLSQGDPKVQTLFSERICRQFFADAMDRFVKSKPNNFVQFYFEEAHNLFPKKDDKDLSQIYNRLAKEGAKLNIGLLYATQEVSSISGNILKNTQNWFVAHLNNGDELREVEKFYDFGDFAQSLIRFSAESDKGFVRMKTYSNPFVVPVQVDRFTAKKA